jgi:hypothetical protein
MIVIPRERKPRKKWGCKWKNWKKYAQPKKKSFYTLHYQLYQHGQENNAAESLASIRNNSGNNGPRDVSADNNVGGDHAINNNNRDVAVVNNVDDTEIIHDSCGTGPDVHIDHRSGMGDSVGDNDNGSQSPGGDNGFEVGQLNNIEPRDVAAVGNAGGSHAINNNHCDVAVVNNVGNNEFVNDSCATGPDINVGDQKGMVDIVAALNSDPGDVAILQQQRTSLQQPEICGITNINNENQEQGGDDSVDNATGQASENSDTGHQITTRTGTDKVSGDNELGTEDCPGLASVPTCTYLQEQLALRDIKIVAMEQSISQLIHAVKGLQQRWWQPVLIIDMPDIQCQFKPLGSFTMSHQEYNDKWGCTSTADNKS